MAYKWPRLLGSLPNLVSVDFSAQMVTCMFADILEEVKNLPPTLKKLRISFHGSAKILKLPNIRTDASSPQPSKSVKPKDLPAWNVASHFPELEELDLGYHTSYTYFSCVELSSADLGLFPATLRKLSIPNATIYGDYSLLNRDLTWLSVSGGTPSESVIASLPQSLTYLAGIRAKGPEEVGALPRTLEYAINAFDHRGPTIDAGYLHRGSIPLMPPKLKAINCLGPSWPPPWVSLLPNNLTDVTLESKQKTCWELHLLPPTVTKQSYVRQRHISKNLPGYWSPALQTLELEPLFPDHLSYLRQEDIQHIPQTLTELFNLAVEDVEGTLSLFKNADKLPPGLTTLSIYARPFFLPESGPGNFFGEGEEEEPAIEHETVLEVSPLPSGLKTLSVLPLGVQVPLTLAEMRVIPRTLTKLELVSLEPALVSELPPNLLYLSIDLLEGSITEDLVKALSRDLTFLRLKHTLKAHIEPLALQHLPSGIYTLILARIDVSILSSIPTTVRRFNATIETLKPSDFDVSSLPPRWLRWVTHRQKIAESNLKIFNLGGRHTE